MMLMAVFLLVIASLAIWLATQFVIEGVEKLSGHTRFTKVAISLFAVGVVASLPEMAISAQSLWYNAPQIALGNLVGTQVFILFLAVPVLAIASKGISFELPVKNTTLTLMLLAAVVPMIALFDQALDAVDVLFILLMYLVFVVHFVTQGRLKIPLSHRVQHPAQAASLKESLKVIAAIAILVLASNTVVRQLIEISALLETPRFLLSLLVLPIATNLPELSLALGSLSRSRRQLAIGDFIGSVTFNSLLIGILAMARGGTIVIGQDIIFVLGLFVIGVIIFWLCGYSQKFLNTREGLGLLFMYALLLISIVGVIMSGLVR